MSKIFERYNQYDYMESEDATKVRIFCRISYANIWEPKSIKGSDPKYSVSCLIDKEDTKTVEMVEKAVQNAMEIGKTKCWGGRIPTGSSFKRPFHDGDEDRPDDAAYAGCRYINATSKDKPDIVGPRKNKIEDPMEVGSGDYCMVTINFYPFNADNTSRGVAAGLSNIQLAAHGERLSGKASADKDFDELPDLEEETAEDGILPDFL